MLFCKSRFVSKSIFSKKGKKKKKRLKPQVFFFETGNHMLPREQELEPLEGQTWFKAAASPETSINWRSVHCPLAPLTSRGGRDPKSSQIKPGDAAGGRKS